MSVKVKTRGGITHISVPTDSNRDAGIFLMFLGLPCGPLLYYLFVRLGLGQTECNWELGFVGGTVLVLVGLSIIVFSRKRLCIEGQCIYLKDGMANPRMRYAWKTEPAIRLHAVEEEIGGKPVEVWLVNLVDGKYQYTLDRRPGQQLASRTLAEIIAKAIGCPVIEKLDSHTELRVERDDLDLPFVERVKKHPALMGQPVERPEHCQIEVRQKDERQVYAWRIMSTAMLFEVIGLFIVLVVVSLVPLSGGDHRQSYSLLDIARQGNDYLYYEVLAILFLTVLVILLGYRSEIVAEPNGISSRALLWGIAFKSASIPVAELENISVRLSSRGAYIQFISDRRIITERLAEIQGASWLAWQIRHFYAG